MVRRHTPSLSFEVFPPNPAVGNDKIFQALREMQDLAPHFISVTASNNKFDIEETTVRLTEFIATTSRFRRLLTYCGLSNQGHGVQYIAVFGSGWCPSDFSFARGYFSRCST